MLTAVPKRNKKNQKKERPRPVVFTPLDFDRLRLLQPKRCRWIGGARHVMRTRRKCHCTVRMSCRCYSLPYRRLRTMCRNFVTTSVRRNRWITYVVYVALILSLPGCLISWFCYHGNGHRIGEASNPGPRTLNLCSMNVTSLRLHLAEIVGLEWDIASIQETGCSSTNIQNALRLCQEYQIDMFHGLPISSEQSAGVAICTKAYHLIDSYVAHSENYTALNATKRWKHAVIPIVKNVAVNLHNVYGYAGANSISSVALNNEALLQMVFLEAAQGGDAPTIIMGDLMLRLLSHPRSSTPSQTLAG